MIGVVPRQNLMERAVTLGIAAGQQVASPALSQLLAQYASLLAAQVPGQGLPASHLHLQCEASWSLSLGFPLLSRGQAISLQPTAILLRHV